QRDAVAVQVVAVGDAPGELDGTVAGPCLEREGLVDGQQVVLAGRGSKRRGRQQGGQEKSGTDHAVIIAATAAEPERGRPGKGVDHGISAEFPRRARPGRPAGPRPRAGRSAPASGTGAGRTGAPAGADSSAGWS